MPRISRPNAMLSSTLRQGNRLRLCQTITESAPSGREISGRAGSWMRTVPPVAGSRPPTIWISVLLPQPLGPRMQEKRRERNRWLKRSSATTPCGPPKICVTSSATTSIPLSPLGFSMHDLSQLRAIGEGEVIYLELRQRRDGRWSHPPGQAEAAAEPRVIEHDLADALRLGDDAAGIGQSGEFPVAVDDLAVDQHGTRIGAFAGADECRDRPVQHPDLVLVEIEHRDVGTLARLQRADLALEPQRLGGADGRHFDRALGRYAGRIEVAHVLQQR